MKKKADITEFSREELASLEFLIRRYANGDPRKMTIGAINLKREIIKALNDLGWYKCP